jgi:hypothetical protein
LHEIPLYVRSPGGWRRSIQWREAPAALTAILALRRYTHGEGHGDNPAEQEARIREGFMKAYGLIIQDQDEAFQPAVDEFVAKIVREMNTPEDDRAAKPLSPDGEVGSP